MRYFTALFQMAIKRLISRRNIILLVLLLILSIYGTQQGIKEYRILVSTKKEFKAIELSFFNNIKDYNAYSFIGLKILYIPGASSFFFSNPILLSELSAKVNSVITLNIFNNGKGGSVVRGNSPFRFRFSNIILVLGSLLALLLGFEPMRGREFLKFLSSQWSPFWVYTSIVLSRVILFILALLVIFGCCLGLAVIQGIALAAADFFGLVIALIPMLLMILFFFIIGTILGSIQSKFASISGLLVVWFFFVFLYPAVINSILEDESYNITSFYEVDSKKLKLLNDFEKKAVKEAGEHKDNTVEGRRKVAEGFWNNDFKEIEVVEEDLKQEIAQLINKYNNISLFMPTTFYTLTSNEVSSRGYQGYMDFYTYLQDLRRKFVRFWIDRVYYHDSKILANFVTADENLFYSKSHVPENYLIGVLINVGYIILLVILSYFMFKRSLIHISAREIKELEEVDLELEKGDLKVWLTIGEHFNKLLFNMFSGEIKGLTKKGFSGEVRVNEVDISKETSKNDFVYICQPGELPGDMKIKDLFTFYARWHKHRANEYEPILADIKLEKNLHKTINQLKNHEKFDIVMGLLSLSKSDVYLINDIASGMPMTCAIKLKNKMEELTEKALVMYLTPPEATGMPSLPEGTYFEEGDNWLYLVESNKRLIEMSKDKQSEGIVR